MAYITNDHVPVNCYGVRDNWTNASECDRIFPADRTNVRSLAKNNASPQDKNALISKSYSSEDFDPLAYCSPLVRNFSPTLL
jgi:hypothetical protein